MANSTIIATIPLGCMIATIPQGLQSNGGEGPRVEGQPALMQKYDSPDFSFFRILWRRASLVPPGM